jgi:group I intron endonuclease
MNNVIYKIEIQGYDKIYIGSAVNFNNRRLQHLNSLRSKKHRNEHLQNVYNKYGEDKLSFFILEQVSNNNELLAAEQKWINSFEFKELINICPIAGNTYGRIVKEETRKKISDNHHDVSGENNPMFGMKGQLSPSYGKKRSEDTKNKISQALKGKNTWCKGVKRPEHSEKLKGENNFWYGKELSDEVKSKISESRKKMLKEKGGHKLTIELVREIRKRYEDERISIKKLAQLYNLSRTYCGQLLKGVYWNDD